MIKKEKELVLARHLRKRGASIKEIAKKLDVAKSSVSLWVRDIKLTINQANFLKHKGFLKEVVQKRIETRLKNENNKRGEITLKHKQRLAKFTVNRDVLITTGVMLYWAEGGKSPSNKIFRFSNSDPLMVRVVLTFLRNICKIPENKLRGHIHLHPHLDPKVAEKFWSEVSEIPISQFHKTSQQYNKRSKNTRDTLPYGTFNLGVYSTDLYLKMIAWIEIFHEKILNKYG